MNCDICHRQYHAQKLPFLCAIDARNFCYDSRIKNLQLIMENGLLGQQISESLSNEHAEANSRIESSVSRQREAEDRTNQIISQAEKLRAEISAVKQEIDAKKALLARRRSELSSATNGTEPRREKQQEEAERTIQTLKTEWNRSHDAMIATRSFLCMEAAKLYGLRRTKKSASSSRYDYKIGGVDVVDLATLNCTFSPVTRFLRPVPTVKS
jgi:predicted RNase H-like nuclease (RuvC/YqgF family)